MPTTVWLHIVMYAMNVIHLHQKLRLATRIWSDHTAHATHCDRQVTSTHNKEKITYM